MVIIGQVRRVGKSAVALHVAYIVASDALHFLKGFLQSESVRQQQRSMFSFAPN